MYVIRWKITASRTVLWQLRKYDQGLNLEGQVNIHIFTWLLNFPGVSIYCIFFKNQASMGALTSCKHSFWKNLCHSNSAKPFFFFFMVCKLHLENVIIACDLIHMHPITHFIIQNSCKCYKLLIAISLSDFSHRASRNRPDDSNASFETTRTEGKACNF